VTIALAYLALSAHLIGAILEKRTALFALSTTGIVLADALHQRVIWRLVGAIGVPITIQTGTHLQLGQRVEAVLLQRRRVQQPVQTVVLIGRGVHALQANPYVPSRYELH